MATQEHDPDHPTLIRLREQKSYYSSVSAYNRRWYKGIKFAEMAAAVAITALAWSEQGVQVVGWLGLAIFILEGLHQLNQYHMNWLRYRITLEKLKSEEHLFKAEAGPYRDDQEPIKLLAERMESILLAEQGEWQSIIKSSNIQTGELLHRAKTRAQG